MIRTFGLLLLVLAATGAPVSAEDIMIAGVNPAQRPANAPKITTETKDPKWHAVALTGVSEPYPDSLQFLEFQGNWFTPFSHPGMSGPYDIRGWH